MKRRKWNSPQKLQIVLEGLKGQMSLAKLCNQHHITQAQYYQWREPLIKDDSKIFDYGGPTKTEEALKQQVIKLQRMIGELTAELKKATRCSLYET